MDEGLKQVEVGMDLAVRKVGLDAVLQMVEHYMPQVEEGEGALLKGTQYIIDLRLVRSRLESRLLLDKVLVQMEMWPAVESLVGSVAHLARHILPWLSGLISAGAERSRTSLRAPPCQRRGR